MDKLKRFYYKDWFIALMFVLWFWILPLVIGILLLKSRKKIHTQIRSEYIDFDNHKKRLEEYQNKLNRINNEIKQKETDLLKTMQSNLTTLTKELEELKLTKGELQIELNALAVECMIKHYDFSEYDGVTSEECKSKLAILRLNEQELIKSNQAINITSLDNKRALNNNIKQMIRLFNSECDTILANLSVKNIETSRNKIARSYESINNIFSTDGLTIEKKWIESKYEQLNLIYTYEIKHQQEKDLQKSIKEQMLEEEKVRREIVKEKEKIEKDQLQCNNEVAKLMKYLHNSNSDAEKNLYLNKINELEEKIRNLEKDKATVLEREANARAGFVYIISNIGSFGENIYKIGMTRRLEPMDRIKELSSASVPFEFDVHAMIFSSDAPGLESALHKTFEKSSVNLVNMRKEFFKVSLDEIKEVVHRSYNNTVEFIMVPVAREYRQSLELLNQ